MMKKVGTTGNVLIFVFLIIIASVYLPYYSLLDEIRTFLTVSTFLFGIIAGFIIASRLSRYSRYRELLTNETGYLITLYQYAKLVDAKFAKKISERIDEYLVHGFLYEVYEYHGETEKQFNSIFSEIRNFNASNSSQSGILAQMQAMLKDMLKDREELYLLGKDRVTFWLKTTLVLLAGLILYSLFLIRTDTTYSFILTILLSTSVVIVLFLVSDLDKLKLYSLAMSYGIYFRVFDAIEKPRLYTNVSLERGLKLPKDFSYRFGRIKRKKGKTSYEKIELVKK